jgi:hypothetical protein
MPGNAENHEENARLIVPERPVIETRYSYSSFQDVGATELSTSVESLPSATESGVFISKWRGASITLSLAILILIQGSAITSHALVLL